MKLFGVAVIGLGVGKGHIAGYLNDPRTEVLAVCDINEDVLHSVADAHNISGRYTDYRELVDRDDIEVVSVCTPDPLHCSQGVELLDAGKHVLMEKPMAVNVREARLLIQAVEANNRVFMVNNILRFSPRFGEVADMVHNGVFGEVFYAEADYIHNIKELMGGKWRGAPETDYSIVHGGGVHMIDLLRWVVGHEVAEVMSYGNRKCYPEETFRNEDCVVSILRFEGGCVAKTLTTIGCQRPIHHNLMVYGTKATFLNESPEARLMVSADEKDIIRINSPYPGIKKGVAIKHFIDCVVSHELPLVNVYEGARTVAVCDAAVKSLRESRPVTVERI